SALPRLALAVLLGAAIAEPLVIYAFRPEVDRQVAVDHQHEVDRAARQRTEGDRAQEIRRNEASIRAARAETPPAPPGMAVVEGRLDALRKEAEAARQALDVADQELTREVEGLSATGRVG